MKIVFLGTPEAAVPTLQRILACGHEVVAVWTQPDRPSGRGRKLKASPIKEFALENGLEIHQPVKIRTKSSIDKFKGYSADVGVVVAYGRILSKSYLNAYPMGCINVHFSLLPKYRGAAPVTWAIANGENKIGVTTMQMDLGLDTGDILLQREVEIGQQENALALTERLAELGAELLEQTLRDYDQIKSKPQKHDDASLAPILKKEDGLIVWAHSAEEIANRVRAFQPFPKSFTTLEGKRVFIWRAEPKMDSDLPTGNPGEIVKAAENEIYIVCGGGTVLRVVELQMEGKQRMNAADFMNGVRISIGDKVGS